MQDGLHAQGAAHGWDGAASTAHAHAAPHLPLHAPQHHSGSHAAAGDEDPDAVGQEGEAAFASDYFLSPRQSCHDRSSPPMDPIAEETDRPSASGALGATGVSAAGINIGDNSTAGVISAGGTGAGPLEAGAVGRGRHSAGVSYPDARRMHASDTGEAGPGDDQAWDGVGLHGARSSAPAPSTLAAAAAAAAANTAPGGHQGGGPPKKPLLQRLSESFRHPSSNSPSPHRQASPSGDCVSPPGHSERSSLMQRMGSAFGRVSASFRAGDEAQTAREGAGGRAGGKASSANRPLASSSTPVVQAYSGERHSAGAPNLRRRGCYAGLVGAYRMHTVHEGVQREGSAADGAAGAAPARGAAVGAAVTPEEEARQLAELKGWLHETTQPWTYHSKKLHRMQAQEALSQALEEAKDPKPVLPQKPATKPKLKTFSLAVR